MEQFAASCRSLCRGAALRRLHASCCRAWRGKAAREIYCFLHAGTVVMPLGVIMIETRQERRNTPPQVLFARLVGPTVKFFVFYIYATAAVLVFPRLFSPASDPASSTLASLATFGIAFIARPIGSALFGHFGDRIGRKKTLVLALLTMGLSTFIIGTLPTYRTIGIAAPLLLALCRFGQGVGLGGEWGGAVLLAVENAPPKKRAFYGMFPQLGAPIGFLFSSGIFLLLSAWLTNEQFFAFGWRIPFLASAVLVLVGL